MRAALLMLALWSAAAFAINLAPPYDETVKSLCPGYIVIKRADDVFVRCPCSGADLGPKCEYLASANVTVFIKPAFTYSGCRGPTMQRASTSVTISCASIVGS